MSVTVNSGFDKAIKETEVVRQRQDEYKYRQINQQILGKTSVAVAEVEAEVTLSEAKALAESVKTVK